MGTMVGDDGGSNQIGVAPKAKWIAANGCCPSDAALIASGQWMLAPKKLNGTRPKVAKRPHIVNNSWGTTSPSDDPFMEDVITAWEASGIFGQWSNGNSGPSCHTSGAPGSRLVTYSSGAYDINNQIASFSARGPGQSSGIKPNISAPGVNVRSSVPGSGYGLNSGTSMASPHVAGAIALLWSAVPSLSRDIDATRALLDDTAIDVSNLTCGGTADDNNVWGEGRLDALALVQAGLAAEED
jgi:subtilisin family serine protease